MGEVRLAPGSATAASEHGWNIVAVVAASWYDPHLWRSVSQL